MEEVEFLTIEQFAKKMKINRATGYEWARAGKIRALKVGDGKKSPWRIPATEILRLRALAYEVKIEEIDENKGRK